MAPRGEVLLQITFGPSKSFVFPRAVTYASEHAKEVAEVHPGIWRASFSLLTEQRAYAHALQLLYMVHGWRASILAVNGDPEPPRIARQMLDCARRWLVVFAFEVRRLSQLAFDPTRHLRAVVVPVVLRLGAGEVAHLRVGFGHERVISLETVAHRARRSMDTASEVFRAESKGPRRSSRPV